MVKHSFVFLVIFSIGMLLLFYRDLTTSVVPGWHTTIYTPGYWMNLIQTLWLGIAGVIYNIIERNGKTIKRNVFLMHIVLSLFLFAPPIYSRVDGYFLVRVLVILPVILFGLGQIIFVFGLLSTKNTTKAVEKAS